MNNTDPSGLADQDLGDITVNGKRIKGPENPCDGPNIVRCLILRGTGGSLIDMTFGFLQNTPQGSGGPVGNGQEMPQGVTVDKSCPAGGPAYDPRVQSKALEAQRLAFSAQQRNPYGSPFKEYGFTGRPYLFQFLFGPGFVTGDIKRGFESNIDLNPSILDTFDVHAHSQATGPSGRDIDNTPPGFTTIVIGRDKKLHCYVGK